MAAYCSFDKVRNTISYRALRSQDTYHLHLVLSCICLKTVELAILCFMLEVLNTDVHAMSIHQALLFDLWTGLYI